MLQATPYTPVFPPPIHTLGSPAADSTTSDSNYTVNEDFRSNSKKPFIDRLKGRYILLASIPQEELCPPSRETSPESEKRIEALRLRMRRARELRFLHEPELTLTCCGLRSGDWVGRLKSDEQPEECDYVLPDTEEEWFQLERKKKTAHERRVAQRKAEEHRQKIAKWNEGINDAISIQQEKEVMSSQERRSCQASSSRIDFPVVKHITAVGTKEKTTISRDFDRQSPPPCDPYRHDSEPVERMSSPPPPAPALDPLPDFSDSFSIPNSPPSLPQIPPDIPFSEEVPPSPSFAKHVQTSTPREQGPMNNPVFQLSSPISPPRSIHSFTVSRTQPSSQAKRLREEAEPAFMPDAPGETVEDPSTPHAKKARIEPITPSSVPRANNSQETTHSPSIRRLPTLTALLASSRKPSRLVQTPRREVAVVPEISPSQPMYSTFCPRFQSSQPRARSLPPSPGQPMTSTQPISPQKLSGNPGSSFSMGLYQSQFNVEGKIDEVAAFLRADVWDVKT